MENLGTGEWIVIGLSLIIGLFFVIGYWINNQRGYDVMRWLRQGLSSYGELQSSRFNAPSSKGIPYQIDPSSQSPYQRIRGNLVLEKRENLPLWAFQRIKGKKDTLIWTCDLQNAPAAEIHLFQPSFTPKAKTGPSGKVENADGNMRVGATPFLISATVPPDQAERLSQGISHLPPLILDIAIQRKSPHLTFQVPLSPLLRSDPVSFFTALEKWIDLI